MPDPLRDDAPLLAAYLDRLDAGDAPFTIPGHKRRASRLDAGLGRCVDVDVPMYGGLGTIKSAAAVVADAERRAAALWGADHARFTTGGSTHANQAVCLALGRPGQRVVLTRAAHRSTLTGLVLAGLEPVWVNPGIDPATGIPTGLDPGDVARALREYDDVCAVVTVDPGYLGALADLPALATVAHEAGVPLVVDQAWAAHLGFHPDLPPHALQADADVLVTSVHKVLPGYSAAAVVLARTDRIDADRLDRGVDAGLTTSPPGAPLASIDGVRALLADRGATLLAGVLPLVARARESLRAVPGVVVPGPEDVQAGRFDPMKLVVLTAGCGADGVAVERDLLDRGVPVEMADRDTIVPIVTVADDEASVTRLVDSLVDSLTRRSGPPRPVAAQLAWTVRPHPVVPLREAFFADRVAVPAGDAVGRVSAELVAPYPPGVPVLAPGELVTAEVVAGLRDLVAHGTRVAYAADPTVATLRVLRSEPPRSEVPA